uniref:Uncharacterized protein n=1 Tax=viral metagenome TaxID=1070528 RepID=A0A6C0C9F8_9ZZZZ
MADGVSLIFGFKISEHHMRKVFSKYIKKSSEDESDEFRIYEFGEYFLEEFLEKVSRKYEMEINFFYPPCCTYDKNKFIVFGINVCYFTCYDFEEISESDIDKIANTKQKIKKLQIIYSELEFGRYCDSVPKYYSVGNNCPRCT